MSKNELNKVMDFILNNADRISGMDQESKVKFIANANHTNINTSACMLHFAEQQTETDD